MSVRPPVLAFPPAEYDLRYMEHLLAELRSYFSRETYPQPIKASTLNINVDTLPTEAALATLSSGDVYRDTTAGNVLKVKI